MSIRLLNALLIFMQIAIALAALLVLVIFAIHLAAGGPFTANWPVVAKAPVMSLPLAGGGAVRIDQGVLALATGDWKPEFIRLMVVGIFATGANFAIARLRAVLAAIAAGKPFAEEIVAGLRLIGWLLIGWLALDVAHALIAQPLLLAGAHPADGVTLGASISSLEGAEPTRAFRLIFNLDWLKLGAGLFALSLARAFSIGRTLADDNAAIV